MDTEKLIIIEFTQAEAIALAVMTGGIPDLPFAMPEAKVRWQRITDKITAAITAQANGQFFQCAACHEK
jgi:hypothetical protein